jgi:hypothetical protein
LVCLVCRMGTLLLAKILMGHELLIENVAIFLKILSCKHFGPVKKLLFILMKECWCFGNFSHIMVILIFCAESIQLSLKIKIVNCAQKEQNYKQILHSNSFNY